jgi:SAM-dependent methyltransferase
VLLAKLAEENETTMIDDTLIAMRWDEEYRRGRYVTEPPLPFVRRILATLKSYGISVKDSGLYVGCGNGRNYLPLVESGITLYGLDISPEAIKYLLNLKPALSQQLICSDFLQFQHNRTFDYLIAIQVFQHGNDAQVARYFAKVASLLKPGGLFFLRVNSITTEIYQKYTIVEQNDWDGFTIKYTDGPKRGLAVHFFSEQELIARTDATFRLMMELSEDVIQRTPPKTGTWAQWEGIWQKK